MPDFSSRGGCWFLGLGEGDTPPLPPPLAHLCVCLFFTRHYRSVTQDTGRKIFFGIGPDRVRPATKVTLLVFFALNADECTRLD